MKTLKIISFILISITFSSCYFLDHVIPEEYFAEDYKSDNTKTIQSEYIWISHPAGIQCEQRFYHSLEHAKKSMAQYRIKVYDSKTMYYTKPTKCGTPTGTYYKLKIKREDVSILYGTRWVAKKPYFVLY